MSAKSASGRQVVLERTELQGGLQQQREMEIMLVHQSTKEGEPLHKSGVEMGLNS